MGLNPSVLIRAIVTVSASFAGGSNAVMSQSLCVDQGNCNPECNTATIWKSKVRLNPSVLIRAIVT